MDVVWHNVLQEPFSIHGVYYEPAQEENALGCFRRFSEEVGKAVNTNIQWFSSIVAGGRIRL